MNLQDQVRKEIYSCKHSLNETEGLLTSYYARKILVFVFIITDFVTLFSLFDTILVQNIFMALIFTFSSTLVYNYVPIVIASEINARKADKSRSMTAFWIYMSIFAIIAIMTAALRLTTREFMFFNPFSGTDNYSGLM